MTGKISIRDCYKTYQSLTAEGVVALEAVDLDIADNEFVRGIETERCTCVTGLRQERC